MTAKLTQEQRAKRNAQRRARHAALTPEQRKAVYVKRKLNAAAADLRDLRAALMAGKAYHDELQRDQNTTLPFPTLPILRSERRRKKKPGG